MPFPISVWRVVRVSVTALTAVLVISSCGEDPTAPLVSVQAGALLPAGSRFTITTIDAPGASSTVPFGIGGDGAVVGSYRDASGTHGFLLRGGTFTPIDYPGAAVTEARGISRDGVVVGTYRLPGEPTVNVHGFRRAAQGTLSKVDYPGFTNTIAQRILDDGTVLGCRHGADQMETMRGIVIGRSANQETDAFGSMHNGATPDQRRIVGLYTNMMVGPSGRSEGYVIDDGKFQALLVPGSAATSAWDVNARGEVAGVFRDAAGVFHGFVLAREGFLQVDVSGATATRVFGINASGDVVGTFVDAGGVTHGFLGRRTR